MNCIEWLKKLLSEQECVLCEIVRAAARKAGYSKKELKEARNKLGVKTHHQFDEFGETPNYFWYLP